MNARTATRRWGGAVIAVWFAFLLAVASPPSAQAASFTLGNQNGGDGFVLGTFPQFQLFGADNGAPSALTTYTALFGAPRIMEFDFTYTTHDGDGGSFDPAGYILNGVQTQLSDKTLGSGQSNSGHVSVALAAGDVFGWYVFSSDSTKGRGELAVSVVPVPPALPLMAGALAALGLLRRKIGRMQALRRQFSGG